jgi:hypothetical protein
MQSQLPACLRFEQTARRTQRSVRAHSLAGRSAQLGKRQTRKSISFYESRSSKWREKAIN